MSLAIQVQSHELGNLGTQVGNGARNIHGELATLKGQVDQISDSWSGAAQQQFEELYREWQTSAQSLHHALEGISTLLSQAATQYQSTEDQIRSSMVAS
jgi:WXG100 family type VII secretion target